MSDTYSTDGPSYSSAAASIPIDRLVKEAVPDYGVDTDKMREGLSTVAREKSAAIDTATTRQMDAATAHYSDLKEKYAGIRPLDVKPWDADREKAERVQSPLEAFGSAAGIFAMLASGFTKTPMDNALNAGAAAINSARANDFDGYNKAHEAWKQNNELALKRHETERQAFKDAEELYKNDPIAGGAELKAVAARFGAKTELALIDAGYVPQVFEMQKAKSEAAQRLINSLPNLTKMDDTIRVTMLGQQAIKEEEEKLGRPLDAIEQARTIGNVRRLYQQNLTGARQQALAIQERADELMRNGMSANAAYNQAAQEAKDNLAKPAEREKIASIEKAKQEWLEAHPEANGVMPAAVENEIRAKANNTFKAESDAIQKKAAELQAANPNLSTSDAFTQAAKSVAEGKRIITGNRADDIKQHAHLIDENIRVIERVESVLQKRVAAAGLAGRAMRGTERLRDIFGAKDSDRVQMERDVEYLRLNGARLLTESHGRPMAAEAARINSIIGGLNWGDLKVNSLRSLEELKGIYTRGKESALERLNSSPTAPSETPPPEKPKGGQWWTDYPVSGP